MGGDPTQETISSLSTSLADASAHAFAGRVQAIDQRGGALVALGLVAAVIIGAGGLWWTDPHSHPHEGCENFAGSRRACYPPDMPRWIFLLISAALGLSVAGGVLIFLRSPTPATLGSSVTTN